MTKIYGLIEKTTFYSCALMPIEINEDHPDLWRIVNNLKNVRIGIELGNRIHKPIKIGKIGLSPQRIYLDLYKKLKRNNAICFLDNDNSLQDYAEALNNIVSKKNISELDKFKSEVKADYFYKIERNKRIMEQIEKQNPEISFIGASHAFYIHSKGLDNIFIESSTNEERITEEINMTIACSSTQESLDMCLKSIGPLTYSLFDITSLPNRILKRFELEETEWSGLERHYALIEKGKFFENQRDPDFIGTWSLNSHHPILYGFFEMYTTNQTDDKFGAVIIDALGDAKCSGTFNQDTINFIKEYTTKFDALSPLSGKITYSGYKNNDFYHGKFQSEKIPEKQGEFILVRYARGLEQKFINSEDKESLLSQLS